MQVATTLLGMGNNMWANLVEDRQRAAASNIGALKPNAEITNHQINAATRLSKSSKQSLMQMTSMVNQFAGGNPALMRSIIGISNIMQIGAKEEFNTSSSAPYAKILESYYQSRSAGVNLKMDA